MERETSKTGPRESFNNWVYRTKFEALNKEVVAAWERCVNSVGLHMWTEVNDKDPRSVKISVNYVSSNDNRPRIKITRGLTVRAIKPPLNAVHCDKNPNINTNAMLGNSIQEITCSRDNQTITLIASLTLDGAGSPSRTIGGTPMCQPTAFVTTNKCEYPLAGAAALGEVRRCIGNDPNNQTRTNIKNACIQSQCRNAEDIVKELGQGLYPALAPAEIQRFASMIKNGQVTVRGLIPILVDDDRFYNRIIPADVRSRPRQLAGSPEQAIHLVNQVRSSGLGMAPESTEMYRYLAFRMDSPGLFGAGFFGSTF